MWSELGLEDRFKPVYPSALAHERMALMVPGLGELCRRVAENLRRQPGFDDVSTIVTADEIRTNLDIQRFYRENQPPEPPRQGQDAPCVDNLEMHLEIITNFELHRRKTFWVDESQAYLLAKTDPDVTGSDLHVPFASFAFVFTDRHVLSLAERMLSLDRQCPRRRPAASDHASGCAGGGFPDPAVTGPGC